jgi:hypothetical protein
MSPPKPFYKFEEEGFGKKRLKEEVEESPPKFIPGSITVTGLVTC